jgi:glycerol-3-phosphate dehydrogenase
MPAALDGATCQRLLGRYGRETPAMLAHAKSEDFEKIGPGPYTWLELRYAAHQEGVVHLDDLLLRRLRLGITLQEGALHLVDRIQTTVQSELGWNSERWQDEVERYRQTWNQAYRLT